MIDTAEIEFFQGHKHTIIEFSPGVNVIKGRSHAGKSSVMRAIRWNVLNQPRGAHFVSHFKGKKDVTSVGLEFIEDGYTIRKRRGTAVNGYETSAGDLAAMRSDVPEEVQDITKMNEINIQTQGDPYFMLTQTPGKVAKELNKLVGLDIIDTTLGRLNRLSNEAGAKLTVLEEALEKEQGELEDISFVGDLESRIIEIEDLWKLYNKKLARKVAMSDMIEKIQEFDADLKETNEWLTITKPYQKLKSLVEKYVSLLESSKAFKKLYADMQRAETSLSHADSLLLQLNNKRSELLKKHNKEFCKYCGAHQSHWR